MLGDQLEAVPPAPSQVGIIFRGRFNWHRIGLPIFFMRTSLTKILDRTQKLFEYPIILGHSVSQGRNLIMQLVCWWAVDKGHFVFFVLNIKHGGIWSSLFHLGGGGGGGGGGVAGTLEALVSAWCFRRTRGAVASIQFFGGRVGVHSLSLFWSLSGLLYA